MLLVQKMSFVEIKIEYMYVIDYFTCENLRFIEYLMTGNNLLFVKQLHAAHKPITIYSMTTIFIFKLLYLNVS